MASITTRAGKGSPLTNAEVDANFTNLNTELGQKLVASNLTPYLTSATAASTYQPLDADLTSIAGLAGTSGFLKKTAANTWALDTNTYLTGNQSITFTGDATGSGATSVALTLANTGVTAGAYGSSTSVPVVTVDAKGRVTSITTSAISGSLTFTGDVTGTGSTGSSTALTLANSGVTAGAYGGNNAIPSITFDAKGRATSAGTVTPSGTWGISISGNAATASSVAWTNVSGRPTAVSSFSNDSGYITGSYLGDYTNGAYRVIADYSGSNTWYIRSNGRFTWARGHDWTQAFELNLESGTSASNNGWAEFGQRESNNAAGTWYGTRFVQYTGSTKTDGHIRARNHYLGADNSYITNAGDSSARVQTAYGYIDIGPKNGSWCHIYSDKTFYFNQELYVNDVQVVKNSGTWGINITGQAGSVNGNMRGTWNGDITWNAGVNISINGESSFDMFSGGQFGVWNSSSATWSIRCPWEQQVEIGQAGNRGLYVFGSINATGNVTAYYSDIRFKTKVGDIENALDKVDSLEGFYYVENDLAKSFGYKNDKQQVALSAQAVKAVMPEAVSLAACDMETKEDGTIVSKSGEEYLTVDYARLVPLLVEAIKELRAEVKSIKNVCVGD